MRVTVNFYSYFKDLTSTSQLRLDLAPASTLADLHRHLSGQFPKLAGLERSTLTAVGVDYQDRSYVLKEGDEVSLFPPVQGG